MAEIRPFRALRFTDAAGRLQELTCPPYDIISESQRLSYLKRNPHNIILSLIHISRARQYRYALVFQAVGQMEDSFDFEGMEAAGRRFGETAERIRSRVADRCV